MVGAQQLTSVQPGQLLTAPGVYTQQTNGGIGDMLNSMMPLIMMMMVMTKIGTSSHLQTAKKNPASGGADPGFEKAPSNVPGELLPPRSCPAGGLSD